MSAMRRAPTIDDLKVKMCWICREEESWDEPSTPPKVWVHPCSCTLIAHQDCLLEWIKESQLQPSRRENALKCPQCNTRYIIDSRNPFILRIMDGLDRLVNRSGKYATLGIVAGVAVTFAGSLYGLFVLYGAHAVRVYIGDRAYNIIVGDDPKDWSWPVYCNLPFIPLYLLASRLRVFDPIFSTITLPFLLSLTFPTPSNLIAAPEPFALPRSLMRYPPTPWVCILVYPLLRTWYLDMRDRLTHWVLQTQPGDRDRRGVTAHRQPWVLEDNDNGGGDDHVIGADLRIDVDLEGPPQPQEQHIQPANQGANVNQAADRHRRVRVTFSSLGRFISRTLATPWIAKLSGMLLEVASRRSHLLRRLLALDKTYIPRLAWMEGIVRESGTLRKLSEIGIRTPWQTLEMEPVWWRNTVGLSLWIIAYDAVTLVHLFLRKREMQSRRILSRSFAGIDEGTLDLISPVAF